ncbi:MAG: hypothetical protein IMZ62_05545 [Chloroflexi bacterium]|nr:hypothetical protein [Chloroflexota bacterium]
MINSNPQNRKILLAALLGAIDGGVLVAVVTHAFPKMMERMLVGMLHNMKARMKVCDCTSSGP